MKRLGTAIGILFFGGAFGAYIVRSVINELITGTSIGENMNTYLIPLAIFVAVIVAAFFTIFRRRKTPQQ